MTHIPIDIKALKALYQEVSCCSYPYVYGDRRWEILQHFPELIKAAKERDALRATALEREALMDCYQYGTVPSPAKELASLRALLAEADKVLEPFADIRNVSGQIVVCGVERHYAAVAVRDSIKTALREMPTPDANPLDFP